MSLNALFRSALGITALLEFVQHFTITLHRCVARFQGITPKAEQWEAELHFIALLCCLILMNQIPKKTNP